MCVLNLIAEIIFIMLWFLQMSYSQIGPTSPCPELFKYNYDGVKWIGLIEVPHVKLGPPLTINLTLSLRVRLQTDYVGSVELVGSRESVIKNIADNRPVQYRVNFPTASTVPKIVEIRVNNRVRCTGIGEMGPAVTTINLEHNLYTQLAREILMRKGRRPNAKQFIALAENDIDDNDELKLHQATNYLNKEELTFDSAKSSSQWKHLNKTDKLPSPDTLNNDICGQPHPRFQATPLTIGGTTMKRGLWPWLAALYINEPAGLTFQCAGNLISNRLVVTAAHCLQGAKTPSGRYNAQQLLVFLGRHNLRNWMESGAEMVETELLIPHPDWESRHENSASFDADIAVVVLKRHIQYTEFIRPICLWPTEDDDVNKMAGTVGIVAGWGSSENVKQAATNEMRSVELPIATEAECLRSSESFRHITSNRTFCAGRRDGTGPCNGDSGGGFVVGRGNKWWLRGIVSTAIADPVRERCDLREFVVFTDAAKFVNWMMAFTFFYK